MNQFFFGYLSFAWKRLSRSIVYILLIINAFYVQYHYFELFYIPSLPLEDLIYEYQSFMFEGLFYWLYDGISNLVLELLDLLHLNNFESLYDFIYYFTEFIIIFFTTSIPLILTTAFLSWIIMPFVVKEN
tara:strand:+ start:377 stop:766 length:390 start_codon:yes stop_codon:yes gene_type:complete